MLKDFLYDSENLGPLCFSIPLDRTPMPAYANILIQKSDNEK